MDWLLTHLCAQGIVGDDALDLIARKAAKPSLTGVAFRGRWISLSPPTSAAADQMLQNGVPPGTSGTDRAFMQGRENNRQFQGQPQQGEYYRREARRHGKEFTRGEVYLSSLARFPGDPRAFVSDVGQAKKVQEQQREEAAKEEAKGPTPSIPIADKIVDRETAKELMGQTVTVKEYKETREKVKKKITPVWHK